MAWYWYAAIGTRAMPGFAHILLALARTRETACWTRYRAMREGANDARRDAQQSPPPMRSPCAATLTARKPHEPRSAGQGPTTPTATRSFP